MSVCYRREEKEHHFLNKVILFVNLQFRPLELEGAKLPLC